MRRDRPTRVLAGAVLGAGLCLSATTAMAATCLLANPSLEIGPDGARTFGGWNQFGPVQATDDAGHGQRAARISGPISPAWEVAAIWQPVEAAAGSRWTVGASTWEAMSGSLTGGSRVILNVEWRDASEALLDYESFTLLDAASTGPRVTGLDFVTDPAPAGTTTLRVLVGLLQDPAAPPATIHVDHVRLEPVLEPSLDDRQWSDFPSGRTLDFAGRAWRVKGPGVYGPGPNVFCDDPTCVDVDANGDLRMTLADRGTGWESTEVVLEDVLGYGDYRFTLRGAVDRLDPYAVLGMFLWEYASCWDPANGWWNPYNEIDVEISRWRDPRAAVAQFVAQPYDWNGNLERFDFTLGPDESSTHAFRWTPDGVAYRSWRGGPDDESAATLIHSYRYEGPHVPRPERPRVHINLWKLSGDEPDGSQEVVVEDFVFEPACDDPDCTGTATTTPRPRQDVRLVARPNPFNPSTTIEFDLPSSATTRLEIFNLDGRRVRTLRDGRLPAGPHTFAWNGRDDAGAGVGSAVYVVRLRAGDGEWSTRVTLVK